MPRKPKHKIEIGYTYGPSNCLKVVEQINNCNYTVKCVVCCEDAELFGEALYSQRTEQILKESVPCGCGKHPYLSKEQLIIKIVRHCNFIGMDFIGFADPNGKVIRTQRIDINCKHHGTFRTTISSFLRSTYACQKCTLIVATEEARKSLKKTDEETIETFYNSGTFDSSYEFKRSERMTNKGRKMFWWVYYPCCDLWAESFQGDLQKGRKSCNCSINRQRVLYVLECTEINSGQKFLKFGIANNLKQRLGMYYRKKGFVINLQSYFIFENSVDCKRAETEIEKTMECKVITKERFGEGFTETTEIINFQEIVKICIKNNGALNK